MVVAGLSMLHHKQFGCITNELNLVSRGHVSIHFSAELLNKVGLYENSRPIRGYFKVLFFILDNSQDQGSDSRDTFHSN